MPDLPVGGGGMAPDGGGDLQRLIVASELTARLLQKCLTSATTLLEGQREMKDAMTEMKGAMTEMKDAITEMKDQITEMKDDILLLRKEFTDSVSQLTQSHEQLRKHVTSSVMSKKTASKFQLLEMSTLTLPHVDGPDAGISSSGEGGTGSPAGSAVGGLPDATSGSAASGGRETSAAGGGRDTSAAGGGRDTVATGGGRDTSAAECSGEGRGVNTPPGGDSSTSEGATFSGSATGSECPRSSGLASYAAAVATADARYTAVAPECRGRSLRSIVHGEDLSE